MCVKTYKLLLALTKILTRVPSNLRDFHAYSLALTKFSREFLRKKINRENSLALLFEVRQRERRLLTHWHGAWRLDEPNVSQYWCIPQITQGLVIFFSTKSTNPPAYPFSHRFQKNTCVFFFSILFSIMYVCHLHVNDLKQSISHCLNWVTTQCTVIMHIALIGRARVLCCWYQGRCQEQGDQKRCKRVESWTYVNACTRLYGYIE